LNLIQSLNKNEIFHAGSKVEHNYDNTAFLRKNTCRIKRLHTYVSVSAFFVAGKEHLTVGANFYILAAGRLLPLSASFRALHRDSRTLPFEHV
jgi:hypothetical protein